MDLDQFRTHMCPFAKFFLTYRFQLILLLIFSIINQKGIKNKNYWLYYTKLKDLNKKLPFNFGFGSILDTYMSNF